MNPTEKSETKRCNNMEKYANLRVIECPAWDEWGYIHPPSKVTVDAQGNKVVIPGHIRIAQNYNKVLAEKKFTNLQEVKSGDVVKIVPIEQDNPWGLEKICFLDEYPPEFEGLFEIDNRTAFEKIIYEELRRYYQTMGWPPFNPALNYEFSLYDILGIS